MRSTRLPLTLPSTQVTNFRLLLCAFLLLSLLRDLLFAYLACKKTSDSSADCIPILNHRIFDYFCAPATNGQRGCGTCSEARRCTWYLMSAANLSAAPPQQRALSAQGYRHHSRAASSPGPRSASHPHPTAQSYPTRQPAKSPAVQHAEVVGIPTATPSQDGKQNGEDSQLGYPSEQLKMADFELMKTLGTGTNTLAARSYDTVPNLTLL
jgi:hypothetical protein